MRSRRGTNAIVAAAGLMLLLAGTSLLHAEEVEKKWRVSFASGGYNTQSEVSSPSANTLLITDRDNVPVVLFRDPRNDSSVFGTLTIEPAVRSTVAAQYAVNRFIVFEASVGYQKGDVGDIEVQAQFERLPVPIEKDFNFQAYGVNAGEMEQIPIQLSGMARFRPRANFNPYVGAGVGYLVVGFEPDDEFNQLSLNLDNSTGGFAPLNVAVGGIAALSSPSSTDDLDAAFVDARDSFTWHLLGGAELTVRKKLALFVDFRYVFSSREMRIGFNGADSLGNAVPFGVEFEDSETLFQDGLPGAFAIAEGGLIDGGRLAPTATAPAGTDCSADPTNCEFVLDPDGELDKGFYYVQGGRIDYGGVSFQIGLRITF